MEAEVLFNLIQSTIQSELDKTENQHVYCEREMRGTYPTLIIRVLASERKRKPKPGSVILSSPAPEKPSDVPEVPEPTKTVPNDPEPSQQRTEGVPAS